MITQKDIQLLARAARLAGFKVNASQIKLVTWNSGIKAHSPIGKPKGLQAVYIFKYKREYLKVGKAGVNADARYRSHHYAVGRANSSLANSLAKDSMMNQIIGGMDMETWIRNKTSRYNLLCDASLGNNFLNFIEAFFILKCNPRYEG